jgi:cation diffusion facilitator CzcD-associated flavoprotein CzcO
MGAQGKARPLRAVVVGGGISGLAAAGRLRRAGCEVIVSAGMGALFETPVQ